MVLAFADSAVPGECGEKDFMDLAVEWRKLEPPLQIPEHLVIASIPDEMLQQRDMAAAESPPLRGEPRAKCGITRDLQSLQKVSPEQRVQRSLPLRCELLHSRGGCPRDFDRIDKAVSQVELDGVRTR